MNLPVQAEEITNGISGRGASVVSYILYRYCIFKVSATHVSWTEFAIFDRIHKKGRPVFLTTYS